MDDTREFLVFFQDYLAPRLDVYEQAIYIYIARHTILEGRSETVIGFKSARKNMAFGVGKAGTPPSEGVIYEKLRNLETKGCIEILSSERSGTRIKLIHPKDIMGIIPQSVATELDIEDADFFNDSAHRKLILERESYSCFYCLCKLDDSNHVIEHVISRPAGSNSYRNLVASCRRCNNRKDAGSAEDLLRTLYREGLLNSDEFEVRLSHLERLRNGELRPSWPIAPTAVETN